MSQRSLRQSFRSLFGISPRRGDGLRRQNDCDGQASTSTLPDISTTYTQNRPTPTTEIDASPPQALHAVSINESRAELVSLQQSPAPANPPILPLLDHLPSTAAAASTETDDIPERLWNRAYDDLKVNEAALVQAYEKILSRKLGGQGFDPPISESEENVIAQNDIRVRRDQMEQLIRNGLDKTAKEAKAKEYIGTAMDVIISAKNTISTALQATPQAALAWTGVCVALEMFQNPIAVTKANRTGIGYVINRMNWYWKLSSLMLKENIRDDSDLSDIRRELETQVVDLYKALLLYQIKSVCSYYRNRGHVLLRDFINLDKWNGDMEAILKAQAVFDNDSNAYVRQQLVTYMQMQYTNQMTKEDRECLKDLRLTDPSDDKKRIEQTKGGLLQESYRWILDNSDFQRWRNNEESRLLWIRGDPGKGKTMLLCGIVDELSNQPVHLGLVSYFFCQATDQRINNATAVLHGLIFLLVKQQPSLISHVRKKYDQAGKELFKDVNAWIALSNIFEDILHDPTLMAAYLIIDALDECTSDIEQLLDLIKNLSASSQVKWIVSSRNWPSIERKLTLSDDAGGVSLSLEVNADLVSHAVDSYIRHKISQLEFFDHDKELQDQVHCQMRQKANGTFLWVALVFKELEGIEDAEFEHNSDILRHLEEVPSDLTKLYSRMLEQIARLQSKDPEFCRRVLSTATLAYRPLHLAELAVLAGFDGKLTEETKLERLVNKCGSFLTVRNGTVYFVHQSAKDYLIENERAQHIFPSGREAVHHTIFSHSLKAAANKLQKNIYALPHPGTRIDEFTTPHPDPLVSVRYACVYWAEHFCNAHTSDNDVARQADLDDNGVVSLFMRKHFLHWLEALSLLRNLSDGILSISRLETLFRTQSPKGQALSFLQDAHRFFLYNRWGIENSPLQTYISALIFSPENSLIRQAFGHEVPSWISNKTTVQKNWSPCLQILEGHSQSINSVAISSDGQRVISGSWDNTVKIWDTTTGTCIRTLEGHSDSVSSVAISSDGRQVVSGSLDRTVRVWDITTGICTRTLEGHSGIVTRVAISSDGERVASLRQSANKIRVWDVAMGTCTQILEGHPDMVYSIAISSDGKRVASGSNDQTIKVWDTTTGTCLQTLQGHDDSVNSVAISPDSLQVVSGSGDGTIKIWDTITGICTHTLKDHNTMIWSVVILSDGRRVASSSDDKTIKIWDTMTGTCIQTLKGYGNRGAISSNGLRIASPVDYENTIKIWDTSADISIETPECHSGAIFSVAISSDGQRLASASFDHTIRFWDTTTGTCIHTLQGHDNAVWSIAILLDGRQVVSGSDDKTIKIWDTFTGACINTHRGHKYLVHSIAISSDGRRVSSGSSDHTVRIWDTTTSTCLHTLSLGDSVCRVVISSDGQVVAAVGFYKSKIKIWNTATGRCLRDIAHYESSQAVAVVSVALSSNGQRVASASENTVKIWDTTTGNCLRTLKTEATYCLLFDLMSHSRLRVDRGWLDLDLDQTLTLDTQLAEASMPRLCYSGYGMENRMWIVKDGKPVLWLPPDYRGSKVAVAESTVTIGCRSGRVVMLQFSEPESDYLV